MSTMNLLAKLIENETCRKAKARYVEQINDLRRRKAGLEGQDSNFSKYVNYGFTLLKDLPEYYLKANIGVKERIISSIFL